MAAITLQRTYGTTITQALTAFGPNKTQAYDTLSLSTVQSPVTAFITSFAFSNAIGFSTDEHTIFAFDTVNAFGTLPAKVTNSGLTFALTAQVGECALGANFGTLAITLSSQALSGVAGTPVTVDTPVQTLSFPITAVNLPFHGHVCKRRFHRIQHLGGF